MSVIYRKSIEADIAILAPKMRVQDRREVYCSHGVTPLEALKISFNNSVECNSIEDEDGNVVGMFGVSPAGENKGVPWLLASDDLEKKKNQTSFFVGSKEWITSIQSRYQHLSNHVHAGNAVSLNWLERLGFSFDPEGYWGYHPSKFIRFYWDK